MLPVQHGKGQHRLFWLCGALFCVVVDGEYFPGTIFKKSTKQESEFPSHFLLPSFLQNPSDSPAVCARASPELLSAFHRHVRSPSCAQRLCCNADLELSVEFPGVAKSEFQIFTGLFYCVSVYRC